MSDAQPTALRGELRENEPLARLTSWRTGGPAERFYKPADAQDLGAFLATLAPDEPLTWLGLGSNLLVRDAGVRGTVIALHGVLDQMEKTGPTQVRVQAGVPCAKLARFCARQDLVGAEFFAGIPGTLGGALAMNAGAFGGETWERVAAVQTVDRQGHLQRRLREVFDIGYRHVKGPVEEWFVAAELDLNPGDGQASLVQIKQLLARRAQTQPTGVASCGSVFANPPGDFAGRLIEACGLKGYGIGGAVVSHKHANFIVNEGGARASDIEELMAYIQKVVFDTHGVQLTPEVRIVGESA